MGGRKVWRNGVGKEREEVGLERRERGVEPWTNWVESLVGGRGRSEAVSDILVFWSSTTSLEFLGKKGRKDKRDKVVSARVGLSIFQIEILGILRKTLYFSLMDFLHAYFDIKYEEKFSYNV